jgi:RNA polymerase sigma factor (sigma-70 family)
MKASLPDKLRKLWRRDPAHAWDSFLTHYNRLIMSVTKKMGCDRDMQMELYAHALTKLKEEEGKRLTNYFLKARAYNFETWVALVVRKCCLDWFRHDKGRKRPPKCIAELSPVHQQIFQYVFLDRYSYETTHQLLTTKHQYQLSSQEVAAHLEEIEATLRNHNQNNIFAGWRAMPPPVHMEREQLERQASRASGESSNLDSTPEAELVAQDTQRALHAALISLSAEQQLLIELHYYRDLKLPEIARALNMKSLGWVRWRLEKALKLLRIKLKKKGIGPADLEDLPARHPSEMV